MSPVRTKAEARFNAWLTAALLVGIVVVGNQLARRHLVQRFDLSEDQLYTISPATRSVIGRIDDRLQVKAFFTGEIQSGEFAIAKARLEGLLSEYEAIGRGRVAVDYVDPNGSSRVLLEAQEYGLTPYPVATLRGAVQIAEEIYLGLVLRYRGREATVPFALPASFETVLTSRIHELLRERRGVVGWFGDDPRTAEHPDVEWGTFHEARALLESTRDVRRVESLASGEPVPDDLDVLLVVRPRELHPRAVFEIDQYVQRGGRVVFFVDHVAMSFARGSGRVADSGLEELLRAWGAPVTPQHVWDDSHAALPVVQPVPGLAERTPVKNVPYPLFVRLVPAGFNPELAPSANLQDGVFCWAQPIEPVDPPDGARRDFLVRSSASAYRVDLSETIVVDPEVLAAETQRLYALGQGRSYDLAVVLSGALPSPFEAGAPAPRDPLADPRDPESAAPRTTDEAVLSRTGDSRVVVCGDADWIRDRFLAPNARLFQSLVDWLSLDDELVAMRARVPKKRPITDFLAEERRRLGLEAMAGSDTAAQADRRRRIEGEARAAAVRRQWRTVLLPVSCTLALIVAIAALRAWTLRRPLVRARP